MAATKAAGPANAVSPEGAELHKRSETERGSERRCRPRGLGQNLDGEMQIEREAVSALRTILLDQEVDRHVLGDRVVGNERVTPWLAPIGSCVLAGPAAPL